MKIVKKNPTMSSREISELVESRHADVCRTIERLITAKAIQGYAPTAYTHPQNGRTYTEFHVVERDSYVIVAQLSPTFTARLVDRWQELELAVAKPSLDARQISRLEGKTVRLDFTGTVAEFVNYATAQGSTSASKYYMTLTKMEYKALFLVEAAVGNGFRDTLTAIQNSQLATAERVAQLELQRCMALGMQYKEIYQSVKRRVEALVAVIGISLPGDDRPLLGAA